MYCLEICGEWDVIVKLFCKNLQHWEITNGKLILGAKTDEFLAEQLARMTARLEAEIRLDIYEAICALDLVRDRKKLVKLGIDNVAMLVQDACAQIALGEYK
jgi:hypothetical protein